MERGNPLVLPKREIEDQKKIHENYKGNLFSNEVDISLYKKRIEEAEKFNEKGKKLPKEAKFLTLASYDYRVIILIF